ncbi:hypothetical protein OPQ81_009171 [Rhizoctonia solani]|nr:hypothetical protein OPQ81_009171 [Rhizoctonia solani]
MSFSVNKDIKDAKILIHHNESIDDLVTEIMHGQATGEISEAAVHAEGYDIGIISGALVTIESDLGLGQLSNTQKELITLATTLGMLIGGLYGSMT